MIQREEGSQNVCINKPAPTVGGRSLIPWGNCRQCCKTQASDFSWHPQQSNWGIFTEESTSIINGRLLPVLLFPQHTQCGLLLLKTAPGPALQMFYVRLSATHQTPVAMLSPIQSTHLHFLNPSSSPELPWENHVTGKRIMTSPEVLAQNEKIRQGRASFI